MTTQKETNQAIEHFKEKEGIDIGNLLYDERRVLTEAFLHGAEGAIKLLIQRVKDSEADITRRAEEIDRYVE